MKKNPSNHWRSVLAERIKHIRGVRKLSQQQLADRAEISQSTLALLETGNSDPSLSTLSRIAVALDVDVATLFGSKEVFVFDMKRLVAKYTDVDDLSPHMYQALSKVVAYARRIGLL